MNLLDLFLLVFIAAAAVGGYRLGLVARGLSWVGLGVGVFAATFTIPFALRFVPVDNPTARLLTGLAVLVFTVGLTTSVAEGFGYQARDKIQGTGFQPFDRTLGFLAGIVGAIVLIWVLLPAAAQVPGGISRQVRGSSVAAWVRDVTPSPPDTVRALRWLVDQSRFPEVFEELQPSPELGPPPSELPIPAAVAEQARSSTGNVEAEGCGVVFEGSAWVVSEGLMVTNAHVVAGAERVSVRIPEGGVLDATVVAFDDDRDLALLELPGLDRPPLPLVDATDPDTPAAVIGYPQGQNQARMAPARIDSQRTAVGRDIYGEDQTERRILFLSSDLQQGDSGSAVVGPEGAVHGVVFAVSPDRPSTAFALAPSEVRAILDGPRNPGETGRCP
ncbi:MAG: MarP family serine protease [Nitriliruptorales bacterium]|nr:MarP family serine protease [Nitriliruptorales bacterium]